MTFPHITNISDVLPHIKDFPEFRVTTRDGVSIICYIMRDSKTFAGSGSEYRKECRGITFDAITGDIICRPLNKFFNINETEETFEKNIDWGSITRVLDKVDGSMITPFWHDDKLKWKTKNSLGHDVVLECYKLFNETTPEYDLSKYLCISGYTPVFEFTSLINRVVIRYDEIRLTLLAVRHTVTGEYLSFEELQSLANEYNVKLVNDYTDTYGDLTTNLELLKAHLSTNTNFEGFVFCIGNNERFKWKCKWYNELHHMVSFVTEYNVAELALSDTLDDYKSFLVETNSPDLLAKVEVIESKVKNDLICIESTVDSIVGLNEFDNPKDFSLKYKDHELFSLLISKFRDKEPPLMKFYTSRLETIFTKQSI